MLRSYLNLRGKHASIISAFCIKKNYQKYERWFAGANTRTEEKKLACGWRFSRALVYLMAWGQVHLDQRHVELKLFLASALGAQLQAIIFFFCFPQRWISGRSGSLKGIMPIYLHGKFDYILHCNITRTIFWRFV